MKKETYTMELTKKEAMRILYSRAFKPVFKSYLVKVIALSILAIAFVVFLPDSLNEWAIIAISLCPMAVLIFYLINIDRKLTFKAKSQLEGGDAYEVKAYP